MERVDKEPLSAFIHSYIFLVYVDVKQDVDLQVISCRLTYANDFEPGPLKPVRSGYKHDVWATGFDGQDRRVHVRVEAPPGMKMSKVCLIDRRDPKIHYDSKDIRSVLTPQLIELVRSSENGVDERAIRLQLIYMP